MKKLIALLTAGVMLAGCAAGPDKVALQAQRDAIAKIAKIEIFYNGDDELGVLDGGGSNMTGLAGLFGPIGLLVAVGVHANSRLTMAERAQARSKEFTTAVAKSGSEQTLNRQFAEALAAPIRATGKDVKITPTQRIKAGDLDSEGIPEVQITPGYAPLILRITTGYVAKDALSSYRPTIVIEQALKRDGQERPLYKNTFTSPVEEPSYMSYSTILDKNKEAHDGLRRGMVSAAEAVYKSMFAGAQ